MARGYDTGKLDIEQFAFMWNMIRFGYQKYPHTDNLKSYCDQLRQGLIQMDSGMRNNKPKHYIRFDEVGTIINSIAIEAMCLYLSGSLDKLEKIYAEHDCESEENPVRCDVVTTNDKLKYTIEELDLGLIPGRDYIRFGHQGVPDIGTVKGFCEDLQQMMIQLSKDKQKNTPEHLIRYGEIEPIINCVVVGAMSLYLSGALDKIDDTVQQMTGK